MNLFFRSQLELAKKANGITFDIPADWPELQELARLADVVTNAEATSGAAILRPCVEIGGVLFYRVTLGAVEWFQRVAKLFEGDHGEAYSLAYAYTFAGARDPVSMLWPYADDKRKLCARIKEWVKGLGCTAPELYAALEAFLREEDGPEIPGDQEPEEPSKASGMGWLWDALCSEYGGTPEQWVWHTPRHTVGEMLKDMATRNRAAKDGGKTDPNDPRVIASDRFDRKLKAMVAGKKAKNGP